MRYRSYMSEIRMKLLCIDDNKKVKKQVEKHTSEILM